MELNNENRRHRFKTLFRNLDRSVKIVNEFSEFLKLLDLREVGILKAMIVRFMIEATNADAGGLIEITSSGFEFSEVFQYKRNRVVDKDFSPFASKIQPSDPEYSMVEFTVKREMPTLFEGDIVKSSLIGKIVNVVPGSVIMAPIVVNNEVLYIVELVKRKTEKGNKNFIDGDIQTLSIISNIASAIFTNAELFNSAIHDRLTGLYNIHYFKNLIFEEMSKVRKFNSKFSLAIIDLDHFKNINDTYGHSVGDEALKFFSSILKQEIKRSSDIIVRYGGDEFIIAFVSTDLDSAYYLCSKLKDRYNSEPFKINDKTSVILTPSIGIAQISEEDIQNTSNGAELFRKVFIKADTALYNSKKTGRNKITIYSSELPLIEEREL